MKFIEKTKAKLQGKNHHEEAEGVQASVLALIGFHNEIQEEVVLLMKRSMKVETHKGQICFPGGFREEKDKSLLETALRETFEETGLPKERIEIIGQLPLVETRGEILIQPFIGVTQFPFSFQKNDIEVEKLFFLPLKDLAEKGLASKTIQVEGFTINTPGIEVEKELVWGATAKMLSHLLKLF